ncbi:glycoside hydrolase family 2 TIM barrel-domain containing protein [Streptomyces sp. KR80]|uniref:glycoside hydrolase family 2 TIM barrel-domain containing protein n=1 Tax=Streptomyces sp. KR80 TaxID=3457426 RepID=UPI003FD30313
MDIGRRELLEIGAAGAGAVALSGIGAVVGGGAVSAATGAETETLYLTGLDADHTVDWEFLCTSGRQSGTWGRIATPSNWECRGYGTYNYGWNLVPEEKGRYRHRFTPPASWSGRRVYLVFDGSMTDTEAWLNGTSVGPVHRGGFYRFRYDVTALLRSGVPNLLEVTVSRESADDSVNNAERRGDYWNFGGIYRPVSLQAFPSAHVDRIAVDARANGTLSADVYLAGIGTGHRVVGQVRTPQGEPVGTAFEVGVQAGATRTRLTTSVSGPKLWTAETPDLYRLDVRLVDRSGATVHSVSERFGFRTVEVRRGDGVYVNGKKIILKGCNRHTIWPTLGRASSPRLARQDILLMKEMNMNAVRMSHYPPDMFFLDLCDELGLYVMDELAGWQKSYSERAGAPLVAETVIRDVNHPSILFWANGNEGGWNPALDAHFARYDPQGRAVLHPWANFGGVNTDHYESYDSTRAILAKPDIFMPTEFLHALYDGGAGAGLNDYWALLGSAPRSAGGFIWAFCDEGVARGDRGGAIDVMGNAAPDGIVGPYREKEGSFFAVKDIWSPVQLANPAYYTTSFPSGFDGTVRIVNGYDFHNLSRCSFEWQLLKFRLPGTLGTTPRLVAQGVVRSPDIVPGATGTLVLDLPEIWGQADALRVTTTDPSGQQVADWVWMIKKAADFRERVVVPHPTVDRVTVIEDAAGVTMTAGTTSVTIAKNTGRLARVERGGRPVPLANGPALVVGTSTLRKLTHFSDGTAHVVQADYTGDLRSVRWRLDTSGWLRLDYHYHRTGLHDFLGVTFAFPESQTTGVTWLGDGPHRVWKNRRRGVTPGVWTKDYNDTATGAEGWKYPEFKGYHANTRWAVLHTTTGNITMVAEQEGLFLRLFTPRVGHDPRFATAPFPPGDISFLDGIPAIGNKFHATDALGPESRPNLATGDYRRTLYFRFGA